MNLDDYLVRNVTPEEFTNLKKGEEGIVSFVMSGFNDHWAPKVKGVKTTFKYNPERKMIGIYVDRGGQQELVVEQREVDEVEGVVVASLYQRLEEGLDRLRLEEEEWVDSVSP